jgi:hypothetical protein
LNLFICYDGLPGSFPIQSKKFFEDLLAGQAGGPGVALGDGFVEFLVGEGEPGGALVVEVGEGPLLEEEGAGIVFGNEARVADGGDVTQWGRHFCLPC